MKPENEKEFLDAFPAIFIPNMFFGVGDGWFFLVYEFCEYFSKVVKLVGPETEVEPQIVQIKEKFGALDICYDFPHYDYQMLETLRLHVQAKSRKMCENCGRTDIYPRTGYWQQTLCNGCVSKIFNKRCNNEDCI